MIKKIQKNCTVYIVRHGQTDWNAKGITQGHKDIPLNSEGIKQAKALKNNLKKIKFDAVFSSDLIRARKTAEIITLERKMAVETTRLLRERRYGKYDGKSEQMMKKFYDNWERLSKKERVKYKPCQGYETDEEIVSRFITFLREVSVSYLEKTVLIVSHGGIMRALLNHLSDDTYLTGAIGNGGYIKLKSDGIDFFIDKLMGIRKTNKVLIFGLGLNQGGVGSAAFFAKQRAKVKVTDLKTEEILKPSLNQLQKYKNISYLLGKHKYEDVDWADLIIKNPAIKPGNPYMEYAKKQGKQIETDMGIFLQYVKPSQIIGITGTKGKSTTSSLIYEVLKAAGKKVVLAGNIGKSVLDTIPFVKPDTFVVLEISSFQLEAYETHKVSPKWAVITNITPDHLNYYETIADYIKSKKIIGKYQNEGDCLFLKKNDPETTQPDFLNGLKSKIIYCSKEDLPTSFHPKLLGEHNLENIAVTLAVAKTFGVNNKNALNILSKFKGVPFRMELVKNWHGVKIYNDTTATSPVAGTKAIQTFPGCILICGGMNKKMDYKDYAVLISKTVKKVFFLEGDSSDEIKKHINIDGKNRNLIAGTYNDLKKLLADVKGIAGPKDIVLFAPSATSFNLFQNEFDRGRKFNQAVKEIFI